jgi:hypothetical protein
MELRQMIAEHEGRKAERRILCAYKFFADYGESYKKLLVYLIASIIFVGSMVHVGESNKKEPFVRDAVVFFDTVPHLRPIFDKSAKVALAIVPSGFQKEVAGQTAVTGDGLWIISKLLIISESIVALVLATLFVMAVNRRFRR